MYSLAQNENILLSESCFTQIGDLKLQKKSNTLMPVELN